MSFSLRRHNDSPLPLLPTELHLLIVSSLTNHSSLYSTSLASRAFHDLSTPALYSHLYLGNVRTCELLLRTLRNGEKFRKLVKCLEIDLAEDNDEAAINLTRLTLGGGNQFGNFNAHTHGRAGSAGALGRPGGWRIALTNIPPFIASRSSSTLSSLEPRLLDLLLLLRCVTRISLSYVLPPHRLLPVIACRNLTALRINANQCPHAWEDLFGFGQLEGVESLRLEKVEAGEGWENIKLLKLKHLYIVDIPNDQSLDRLLRCLLTRTLVTFHWSQSRIPLGIPHPTLFSSLVSLQSLILHPFCLPPPEKSHGPPSVPPVQMILSKLPSLLHLHVPGPLLLPPIFLSHIYSPTLQSLTIETHEELDWGVGEINELCYRWKMYIPGLRELSVGVAADGQETTMGGGFKEREDKWQLLRKCEKEGDFWTLVEKIRW